MFMHIDILQFIIKKDWNVCDARESKGVREILHHPKYLFKFVKRIKLNASYYKSPCTLKSVQGDKEG